MDHLATRRQHREERSRDIDARFPSRPSPEEAGAGSVALECAEVELETTQTPSDTSRVEVKN